MKICCATVAAQRLLLSSERCGSLFSELSQCSLSTVSHLWNGKMKNYDAYTMGVRAKKEKEVNVRMKLLTIKE